MKTNCIIVEDEPLAKLRLEEYVQKVPFLHLLHSFDNSLEAVGYLQREPVDLLLLDVQMDELSGIGLLESLPHRPEVILCTAFEGYALKGYELQVADYLLKPFSFERFLQAVLRVQDKLLAKHQPPAPAFLFIKTEHRLQKVPLDELLFIEGMRDYRRLHCVGGKLMTPETFKELEAKLPERLFCRVHKSYLVALGKIESVERDRIRIGKELIPVSETYKQQFYRLIQ